MNKISKSFRKIPIEQKIYGAFFLISGIGTAYLANAIINFFHLLFTYGPKEVFINNLHFVTKRMTIIVSNGDQLSSIHSILNFITACIVWIFMLILTHLLFFKILKKLNINIFINFFKIK